MTLLVVSAILFLAAFVRSLAGFGDALIAMPLLAAVVGLAVATPVVGLATVVISVAVLATSWRSLDLATSWRLLLASAAGMPLGLLLLTRVDEWVMHLLLGLVLVGYGLYNLLRPGLPALRHEGWAFPFGLVAGILGSAYNTSGPPVIIYGTMRRWPPDTFRATLQGFFLVNSLMIVTSHGLAGLWTRTVWEIVLWSLPALLLGIVSGIVVQRRIPDASFGRLVYALLVALGVVFLLSL